MAPPLTTRALIVGRIKPGSEEDVAAIFAASDATELPGLAGVRHRSLFVFKDVYIHLIESEADPGAAIERVRDHPLFREISRRLEPHIAPFDPASWRGPRDALAREFYTWDSKA